MKGSQQYPHWDGEHKGTAPEEAQSLGTPEVGSRLETLLH